MFYLFLMCFFEKERQELLGVMYKLQFILFGDVYDRSIFLKDDFCGDIMVVCVVVEKWVENFWGLEILVKIVLQSFVY